MTRERYLDTLQETLPAGVELYCFAPSGQIHVVQRGRHEVLDPARREESRSGFLRFIDDGQFTRYLVGSADTSELNPTNATTKVGVVRPHSAFTPHAHGAEHFVLSLGYAQCGLYDEERDCIVQVRLTPNSLLHIPAMMPHSFGNRSADPLVLVVANTGMGIEHEDYAITAAQAEGRVDRAATPDAAVNGTNGGRWYAGEGVQSLGMVRERARAQEAVNYAALAAALRRLEAELPRAAARMGWRERVAARLRAWAWRVEGEEG